jgi:dTDP-4-dehydrorhamnose reductase
VKLLLTGAGGQLGRALSSALEGHHVSAFGHANLDIADVIAVRDTVASCGPDMVINAAAFNDVDGAETDGDAAFRVNAAGPANLAAAAAEAGAAILHVSTDYVFDGTAIRPYDEDSATNPQSVYGRSKWAGEEAVRAANPRHYVVRTAWLFHPEGKNFLNTMLGLASRGGVRVVDDQTGSPTFAGHLAEAIARLITTDAYGTYHLAGRGGVTWFELTRTLYRLAGITTPVEPVTTAAFPRPAPRPRYSVLTTIREPRILLPPWEEGVAAFVRQRLG